MRRFLLVVLLLSLLVIPQPATGQDETVPTQLEIEIHIGINEVRGDSDLHDEDLAPLKLQSDLIEVARKHSEDMLERDFFAHINPDDEDAADRVSTAGIEWSRVGENLFYTEDMDEDQLAEAAVDGWVDSPGHFANIITDFSYTGIGIARSGRTYYVTQVFVNADPSHLEDIGVIYDNDNLDDLNDDDSGFQITARMGGLIVIGLVVLIGLDAKRRNDKYYGRRR